LCNHLAGGSAAWRTDLLGTQKQGAGMTPATITTAIQNATTIAHEEVPEEAPRKRAHIEALAFYAGIMFEKYVLEYNICRKEQQL
jgi:hypothetical protein